MWSSLLYIDWPNGQWTKAAFGSLAIQILGVPGLEALLWKDQFKECKGKEVWSFNWLLNS